MVKKEVKKTAKRTMKTASAKKAPVKKASTASVSGKKLSIEDLNGMIAKKAYEFYLERGGSHGDDHSDWYRAECFIRSRYGK